MRALEQPLLNLTTISLGAHFEIPVVLRTDASSAGLAKPVPTKHKKRNTNADIGSFLFTTHPMAIVFYYAVIYVIIPYYNTEFNRILDTGTGKAKTTRFRLVNMGIIL